MSGGNGDVHRVSRGSWRNRSAVPQRVGNGKGARYCSEHRDAGQSGETAPRGLGVAISRLLQDQWRDEQIEA